MPLHFKLDYVAPFQCGDSVYVPYGSNGTDGNGRSIDFNYVKGKISRAEIIFVANPGSGRVVTDRVDEVNIGVSCIKYRISPDPEFNVAAFDIEWSFYVKSQIFATEEEVRSSLNR